MKIRTASELAKKLGVGKSYVTALRKKDWFPVKSDDGWDLVEVQNAMNVNLNRRKGVDVAPDAGEVRAPVVASDDERIVRLLSGDCEPLEIARISVQFAARTYASNISGLGAGARDLDNLKRALDELRRAEDGYLDLAERKGELISRDVAKSVIGLLVARFAGLLSGLEDGLGSQVEIWSEDQARVEMSADDRLAMVREWFSDQVRSLRDIEADEIEGIICAECK